MLVLAMLACKPTASEADADADADADTDTDADTDADADSDADTDADADSDADTDPPSTGATGHTGAETAQTGGTGDTAATLADLPGVRFIVLGDGGRGNNDQYAVAQAAADICASQRCDFALYLGDNVYNVGVTAVDDPQFESKFELPYAALDFPFYTVLGNHDYANNFNPMVVPFQVEYTAHSSKWTMPDLFYDIDLGPVHLFGLDTTAIQWGEFEDQQGYMDFAFASSTAEWKIAFGHHPYKSNGVHGNAGAFDNRPASDPLGAGADLEDFFADTLCGAVDVYFAGHDHDRQWLGPTCGVELIVSGAAASSRWVNGDNPTLFESGSLGFMHVTIDGPTFTGKFYDRSGVMDFQHTLSKAQ